MRDGNKRKKIEEYLIKRMKELFITRAHSTMLDFAEMKDSASKSLLGVIHDGISQVKVYVDEGEKGKIRYIHFSYLLSEVIRNRLTIKIDFYDEQYFSDISEVDLFWKYDELFPYIEDDVKQLYGEIRKQFAPLLSYELTDVHMPYHAGILLIMREIIKELVAKQEFSKAMKEICDSAVMVMYGGYLDKAEIIGYVEYGGDKP